MITTSHIFDPTILREYDIRGQVGKNLSNQDAYMLGHAFGTFIIREHGAKTVAVGYDGRHTSPDLSDNLIKGLSECGLDVTTIGLGPSPMLYFTVKHLKLDAGIMVTGSHNPPDYNGFKMMLQDSGVYGDTIQKIGNIAANGDFASDEGSVSSHNIQSEYVERLLKDLTTQKPLKIAWDNGNGAAGDILQQLVKHLPGEHILLYEDIDGQFPNHHPDPTVDKNLIDLQKCVHDNGCDLGIAFDGDGDRIGVVDENGTILRCDILMTIYAREVLKNNLGAAIIGDVKCSSIMFDDITRMGGEAVMWKTGHSLIKSKMQDMKAPLAGELSGHIFFADKYYGYDDALYCAIRLMNAVGEAENGLSSLTAHLPKLHSTPEVRFEVPEQDKFNIVPRIAENLKNIDNIAISEIDGVRITTDDGWWLLRASNTQDVLVARAEGHSAKGLERLKSMAITQVKSVGYELPF